MDDPTNHFDQPVGYALPNWQPPQPPQRTTLAGIYCRLEPLDAGRHATDLHAANKAGNDVPSWTYMPYGPFESAAAYTAWAEHYAQTGDPQFYAIIDSACDQPLGVVSYLNIKPGGGSIEIGHVHYADALQRTRVATEAIVLLLAHAFELGYRRVEWKCDALNAASRRAAERFGFGFEGIFRQATVYKQRNRDTAWYAMTDADWPALKALFSVWLDADNFDAEGQQRQKLSTLTKAIKSGNSEGV